MLGTSLLGTYKFWNLQIRELTNFGIPLPLSDALTTLLFRAIARRRPLAVNAVRWRGFVSAVGGGWR
jgi:hypothetical protein